MPMVIFSSTFAGKDYVFAGVRPGVDRESNLRFKKSNDTPNNPFTVTIMNNPELEPVKTVEVHVECEENCYLPRTVYTITIIDSEDDE